MKKMRISLQITYGYSIFPVSFFIPNILQIESKISFKCFRGFLYYAIKPFIFLARAPRHLVMPTSFNLNKHG